MGLFSLSLFLRAWTSDQVNCLCFALWLVVVSTVLFETIDSWAPVRAMYTLKLGVHM